MKGIRRGRGFTLLEVLIAIVILGVGLLGLAGLLMVSVRTNQSAYLRTQASFLAQSMADRMRTNMRGVVGAAYNVTVPVGGTAGTSAACPCSVAQLAARDLWWWSQEMRQFLPNASATIACVQRPGSPLVGGGVLMNTALVSRLSFDGICTISMSWSESTLNVGGPGATGTGAAETQTFVWAFQP